MNRDSLGLIIHSVHRPQLLSKLLGSVEAQIDRNFQVLLVNNGGTSETSKVMTDFQRSSELNTVFVHEKVNAPFDLLRAAGFASVVCFIGDDDLLDASYTQEMRTLMSHDPGASMYAFATSTISARGIPLGVSYFPFRKRRLSHSQQVGLQLSDCALVFETTGFRLERVSETDLERSDFDYVVDWWLELLVLATGPSAVSWKRIYRKRIHSKQISTVADRKAFEDQRVMMMKRVFETETFKEFLSSSSETDLISAAEILLQGAAARRSVESSDLIALQALLSAPPLKPQQQDIGHRLPLPGEQRIKTVESSDFHEIHVTPLADLITGIQFAAPEALRRIAGSVPFMRRR